MAHLQSQALQEEINANWSKEDCIVWLNRTGGIYDKSWLDAEANNPLSVLSGSALLMLDQIWDNEPNMSTQLEWLQKFLNLPNTNPVINQSFWTIFTRRSQSRQPLQKKRKRDHDSDEEAMPKAKKPKTRRYSAPDDLNVSQTQVWVGRQTELAKMCKTFEENTSASAFRPAIIAIGGPCGIGKTRLATQFINNVKFDRQIIVDVPANTKDINELLKRYLESDYDTIKDNLINFIEENLAQRTDTSNSPLKCVIHLDEIQHLQMDQLVLLRHAIRSCCSKFKQKVVIQLIISGVHVAFMRAASTDDDWEEINTSTGGIHLINLQPLRLPDATNLLTETLSKMHQRSNAEEIVKLKVVAESLRWIGGNPRLVEFLASGIASSDYKSCSAKTLLRAVKRSYWNMYSTRLEQTEQYYKLITSACLARLRTSLGSNLTDGTDSITIKKLIFEGSVVWTPVDKEDKFGSANAEGYLSLPLAVIRMYIKKINVKSSFSLELFTPDKKWTWEEFEVFIGELMALRLQAFWQCGLKEITLREFFEGFQMSKSIMDHKIPLGQYATHKLQKQCVDEEQVDISLHEELIAPIEEEIKNEQDEDEKEMKEKQLKRQQSSLCHLVVKNARLAPSWDSAVYSNNKIWLAIQTKHTTKDSDEKEVHKAEIMEERRKVPADIPLLFITNRPLHADTRSVMSDRNNLIVIHKDNFSKLLGAFGELWRFT